MYYLNYVILPLLLVIIGILIIILMITALNLIRENNKEYKKMRREISKREKENGTKK